MSKVIEIEEFFIELDVNSKDQIPVTFVHEGKEFLIPISRKEAGTFSHIFRMHDRELAMKEKHKK